MFYKIMGSGQSTNKINFQDIQESLNSNDTIIINTLPDYRQECLINGTISADSEINIINKCLKEDKNIKIIIYGESSQDDTVLKKYDQLRSLGFYNIYIYSGGLFEWLLLQDIYGEDLFPTTSKILNHLRYCGSRRIGIKSITNK